MYVAGWTFHVLDNAFFSHWGFQWLAQRPQWRAQQQTKNNARFDEFAKEVTARFVPYMFTFSCIFLRFLY